MISAADFDEVFGWNRAQTGTTLPRACVNSVVDADLRSARAFADEQTFSGHAHHAEVRHAAHHAESTVATRSRDLVEIAN